MDEHQDPIKRILEAAADCQIRMQVDLGMKRMERYLANMAAFNAWSREHEATREESL